MYPRRSSLIAAVILLAATAGCGSGPNEQPGQPVAQNPAAPSPALQQAVGDDAELRRFYEGRQWQSVWDDRAAKKLEEALGGATRHGLDPQEFLRPVQAARDPAARDVALSKAALTYAGVLARGKVDPKRLFPDYTLARNEVDVAAGLGQAVSRGNVGEWLEGLAPQDADYKALSDAYVRAVQAQAQPAPPPSGPQPAPAPNARSARNPQQQARTATPADPREQAVVLAVNLERRRWLARDVPATRIDVNTAASFLTYVRDNALADRRVVVNGQPGWETPQLQSPIVRLVANPDWTVPNSIADNELSKLSPAQLERRHMSRRNGRIVQEPGPTNALGQVKLDMENDQYIYLHDTPSKWAFGTRERHLSHGCVRVNDAVGFARALADQSGKAADFDQALRDPEKKTTPIPLAQALPVRLLYFTAFLDNGQVVFAPDAYGWDAKVAEALGLQPPQASRLNAEAAARERQEREGDVGP